jgi:uncharacterized protein YndB with AHSA1/START domain
VVGSAGHDHRRRPHGRAPRRGLALFSRNSDGSETAFQGTYREVDAPERIVQTFEWEGMPGYVSVETASFEEFGDRTKVTTTSLFHTTEERDGMLASGMERGLNDTYARLDALLAGLSTP